MNGGTHFTPRDVLLTVLMGLITGVGLTLGTLGLLGWFS